VPEMEVRQVARSVSSLGRISEGSWGEMSQISQAASEGSTDGGAEGAGDGGAGGCDDDLFEGQRPVKRPSGGWGKWQAYFP